MKIFRYIFSLSLLLSICGCNDEYSLQPTVQDTDDDKIILDLSLDVAEIASAQSRAFSDTPNYDNLELYVLEFELAGNDPFGNNLTKDYTASIENQVKDEDGDIHYKITLDKIDQPRALHLIAVPEGTELNIGYGTEGSVIPGLQLDNSTPAYWNRIEFGNGYGSYDDNEVWTIDEDLE